MLALHPNMYQFRQLFADTPVRMVSQGEVDVQQLLKQSALLITDYSSVGWDFSFLDKPVIFFQFDRNRWPRRTSSRTRSCPARSRSPRTRCSSNSSNSPQPDSPMTAEYRARADRFIDHRDRNNSERIFQHVRH